jgi:signal transduction histidine kinase
MNPDTAARASFDFNAFVDRYARSILLIISAYLVCMWFSERFLAHPGTLFPAAAVALSLLFLEGIELWPAVYVAALLGGYYFGYPPIFLLTLPVAHTLTATLGAYLLRALKLDALFRTSRDIFVLFGTVVLVSTITPLTAYLTNAFSTAVLHVPYPISSLGVRYVGTLFSLLIVTPFLLRWFTKSRFKRTWKEIAETIAVFIVLIALDYLIFIRGVGEVLSVPVVYLLLIPLFWIALRLRPRFVTLAMLITSVFGIGSLYTGPLAATAATFTDRLFTTEEFLIVLAAIFFVIVSLEEDRRRNSNLLRAQVSTLENAVLRISSESKAKNDFIAVLAHELRNPLAPVASGIDLLRLQESQTDEGRELLSVMEDRMQTVRRLLDDLLDISRIVEGKVTVERKRMTLEPIIRRAVLSTMHHFTEKHQELTFHHPKTPSVIEGDRVRIEQIFSNLLTNASKYSDPGGRISITVERDAATVRVNVKDRGMGIKRESLERIFLPFHQLDPNERSTKGLGLGLALVKSFAEMHGGSVTAVSEGEGRGSTFTVLLPLAVAQDRLPEETAETAPLIAETELMTLIKKRTSGPTVLVVDDNDIAAASLGKLLELKGCSVHYAYTGEQALAEARTTSPDIIILDIGLPDHDGYSVAKMLRAIGFTNRLIALTGFSTEDARQKGAAAGFDHYLVKPVSLAELKKVIPELT